MGEEELEEENQQSNSQIEPTETSEAPKQQDYEWPKIRFDIPPYRTYHFHKQFGTGPNPINFLKGVKWSPDGSCFLTSSEDNTLRLFSLSPDGSCFLTSSEDNTLRLFSLPDNGSSDQTTAYSSVSEEDSYVAQLVVNEGESVYDFCWYPYMSSSGYLLGTTNLLECLMYTARVEILHNIQHYNETKKVKQVLYQQLLFVLLTLEC